MLEAPQCAFYIGFPNNVILEKINIWFQGKGFFIIIVQLKQMVL
jgi:hypothetical protein